MSWFDIIMTVIGVGLAGYEAYTFTKGSKLKKGFEAAKEVHEAFKQEQFADTLRELGSAADGVAPFLKQLEKKSAIGDAIMLGARPGATKAEKEASMRARDKWEKYQAGRGKL